MPVVHLSKRTVESLPVPEKGQLYFWDDEIHGLGVVVGKTGRRTFVLKRCVRGRTRKVKLGCWPEITVYQARRLALERVVELAQGKQRVNLTLRQAAEEHCERLAERSRKELWKVFRKHLSDWLDRRLTSISRDEVVRRHRRITRQGGPYTANGCMRYFRACWNSAKKRHGLGGDAPTAAVAWNKEKRRRQPVEDLASWRREIEKLPLVRRDFLLFCLLTGLRSNDAANVRREHVDFEKATLYVPEPKGGRPFEIPLSEPAVEILRRRFGENTLFFPRRDGRGPIVERRWRKAAGCSPHRLRDAYISTAVEIGVDLFTIKCLVNHRLPTGDITVEYARPSLEHLRTAQERISQALTAKMEQG